MDRFIIVLERGDTMDIDKKINKSVKKKCDEKP